MAENERSAQPAVASGPLSADGLEIRVGDRVGFTTYPEDFSGVVENVGAYLDFRVRRDPSHKWSKESPTWTAPPGQCRHIAPIAAPPGVEKAKCGYCGDEKHDQAHCEALHGSKNDPAASRASARPAPSLAAFTAAVHEHLLPRLPKGWKAITDSVAGEMWLIWILDAEGAEVHFAQYASGWDFTDGNAAAISTVVAERVLARMSRAAEKPRGGG